VSRVVIELEVRRFGDSLGVVLPEAVTNRLRTEEGQSLYLIEAPDGSYRLTQYDPSFEAKMSKVEDIAARYRNTLNILAN
jgi:antitoxin component of MazEF toxin-antitoxin module